MRNVLAKTLILASMLGAAALAPCQRPGDLVVTPTRVLLNSKNRVADITLVNCGSEPIRYRLTLVDMEMSEDGVLKRVASVTNSASNVLRLSPREVVLEPGVSQRVKVAISFPAGMGDGELRSHLAFEPIPTPKAGNRAAESATLKLNFELRSVVTIPVIAQRGQLAASASISHAEIGEDQQGWFARFSLARQGTRTVRGDVSVSFRPASGGEKILVGQISGLPVYFPNADRIVTVRLNRDVRSLGKGEFEIVFAEAERGREAATARTAVELRQ